MRDDPDQYGITGGSYWAGSAWDPLYTGPLQDLELMISQAEADENVTYAGIAKILKAYTFSQMVDVYGDVPFSEANKLSSQLKLHIRNGIKAKTSIRNYLHC